MRYLAWLTAILFLSLVMTASVAAQETVEIEIVRDADILVIYIGGNQTVNVDGLGFQVSVNGQLQPPFYLRDYPAFQSVNLNNLQTPACFVLRTRQASVPLPPDCQNVSNTSLFSQLLFAADVFWYDAARLQPLSFIVYDNAEQVTQCSDSPNCIVAFPTATLILPTPTPQITINGACTITEDMNLLVSPDSDDDGFSDFEEACILNTSLKDANQDSDRDGVMDEIELEYASFNPSWGDPIVVDIDRDGDWLFDTIELELGTDASRTDPSNPDTDGDFISDFLEFYWLGTDPRTPERDDNRNGFPDVLEGFLAPSQVNARCRVTVTFLISELWIVAPEEADSFDIVAGDEPLMDYGLSLAGASIDNNFRRAWSAEGVVDEDRIRGFDAIPPMTAACGQTVQIYVSVTETDAPFGGVAELGENNTPLRLIYQRVPIAWNTRSIDEPLIFSGVVEDGDYDYRLYYSLLVQPLLDG